MSRIKFNLVPIILLTAMPVLLYGQNVGINVTGATPNTAAILDLNTGNAGNVGFLPPQAYLTNVTLWAPVTGAATIGMIVYNTNALITGGSGTGYYFWGTNSQWNQLATGSGAGAAWMLTGNAGTFPGINFLGTTDAEPLEFKVDNQKSGWIDYAGATANTFLGYMAGNPTTGCCNVAFGWKALSSNTSGYNNTAIGMWAMGNNTTGGQNTAVGEEALWSNTTGNSNVAIGDGTLITNTTGMYNTAIGISALSSNTVSFQNTALGSSSLFKNTGGNNNTSIGSGALYSNTTASENTAIGVYALYSNTTGTPNIAMGYQSLYSNTTGNENTAIGNNALYSTTTGDFNTALGNLALYSNTIGIGNTAIGRGALYSQTGQSFNTAVGFWSLYSNTTGVANTALGDEALYTNTSGQNNTAIGESAEYFNTTGVLNTAIGSWSLYRNTTGICNTAGGYYALNLNTTGTYNTAFGSGSLAANTSGSYNTSVGNLSLTSNTVGTGNTADGREALFNSTGDHNTALGDSAGHVETNGNNNTYIGYNAEPSVGGFTNAAAIGAGAVVTANNNMIFGNTSVVGWGFGASPLSGTDAMVVGTNGTNGNGATLTIGGVWTNASDSTKKFDIKPINYGLSTVMQLKPVRYKMKGTGYQDIGFLAQQVKTVIPEIVYGKEGHMSISYGQITPVLVKAVQQQQVMIDSLMNAINDLHNIVCKLNSVVKKQNEKMEQLEKINRSDEPTNAKYEFMQTEITQLEKTVNSLLAEHASITK